MTSDDRPEDALPRLTDQDNVKMSRINKWALPSGS
jgi:hypothetical protein